MSAIVMQFEHFKHVESQKLRLPQYSFFRNPLEKEHILMRIFPFLDISLFSTLSVELFSPKYMMELFYRDAQKGS